MHNKITKRKRKNDHKRKTYKGGFDWASKKQSRKPSQKTSRNDKEKRTRTKNKKENKNV